MGDAEDFLKQPYNFAGFNIGPWGRELGYIRVCRSLKAIYYVQLEFPLSQLIVLCSTACALYIKSQRKI